MAARRECGARLASVRGVSASADPAERARAWARRRARELCDRVEPWEHGRVWRSTRYPDYWEMNFVSVERDTGMSARALTRVADTALAGLGHRWIKVHGGAAGSRLRSGFEAEGWRAVVLVWMLHGGGLPPDPVSAGPVAVEEVHYDEAAELLVEWHAEDFPGDDPSEFHAQMRELALAAGIRVLGVRGAAGRLIAFASIEVRGSGGEIGEVYVTPAHRGSGLGTALTRAAIAGALEPGRDLWICADDEARPKDLYARLGFRPVWRESQFFRVPAS